MIVGRRRSPVPGVLLAIAVPLLFAAGIAVRLWVWPARGLAGDIDQFVAWVNGIATGGWGNAYDQDLSFPAVMAWVWGALATLEPAFRTVRDASDPAIAALMKIPASVADIGLAVAVGWWFREKPWAAATAMGALLLWPVTWYVSAWWGQYEAIYVLPAVLALLAVRAGLPSLAAVFLALSLMTKPAALPFVVPFAAWFLATQGVRGTLKGLVIGAVVCVLVWLPFVGANGPLNYLDSLGRSRDAASSALSAGAWNPWWVEQGPGGGGDLVTNTTLALGPLTFEAIGLGVGSILALLVFAAVYRRPSPQGLALGLAAVTLVTFTALTTMDARFAYPAFVFLLMAANGRVLVATWIAFSVAFLANLVWVAPAPEIAAQLPDARTAGLAGAAVIGVSTVIAFLWLARADRRRPYDDVGQPLHSLWPTMR